MAGAQPALAQTLTETAPSLFDPSTNFDGRLARPGTPARRKPTMLTGATAEPLPTMNGVPAASGAASTGYDSRNRLKKSTVRKGGRIVRPEEGDETDRRPPPKVRGPAPLVLTPAVSLIRPSSLPPQPAVPTASAPLPEGIASRTILPPSRAEPPPGAPAVKRKTVIEEDPYSQLGIRAGAFTLKPAVELTLGYDTNPARATPAIASPVGIVAPELQVTSDWERHALGATIRGSYTHYPTKFAQEIDCNCDPTLTPPTTPVRLSRPSLDARVDGRVDLGLERSINAQGRYVVGTDNPGSPNVQFGLARLPIYTDVGGTLGYTQKFNRFEAAVTGKLDRFDYTPSELTGGISTSNADRNYITPELTLRGSYEVTPGFKPFVEASIDRRIYDLDVDRSGYRRHSTGNSVKVGSSFELTRLLTGSVAIGRLARFYADPSLPNLSGMLVDASLVWSATPLTTVIGTAKTAVQETITAGVSGAFTRDFGIEVDHAFRRWLIATAKAGFGESIYTGSTRSDRRYSLSGALTYKLSRTTQVKAELRQDWLRSTSTGVDYTATAFLVGLRWQR